MKVIKTKIEGHQNIKFDINEDNRGRRTSNIIVTNKNKTTMAPIYIIAIRNAKNSFSKKTKATTTCRMIIKNDRTPKTGLVVLKTKLEQTKALNKNNENKIGIIKSNILIEGCIFIEKFFKFKRKFYSKFDDDCQII